MEVPPEDPDRQLIGNHPALGGILFNLAADAPGLGNFPENLSHGDVDQVWELSQHGPLRSLATAGHAEQHVGAVPGGIIVHGFRFPRVGTHEITYWRETRDSNNRTYQARPGTPRPATQTGIRGSSMSQDRRRSRSRPPMSSTGPNPISASARGASTRLCGSVRT